MSAHGVTPRHGPHLPHIDGTLLVIGLIGLILLLGGGLALVQQRAFAPAVPEPAAVSAPAPLADQARDRWYADAPAAPAPLADQARDRWWLEP